MNSNQRSQENNQSDNGSNELPVSSSRAGTVERDNMNRQSGQSGTLNGGDQQQDLSRTGRQGPAGQPGGARDSVDRSGAQTGSEQKAEPGVHQSNDAAGGLPRSPGGANDLAADQKMDDDTGLSNTVNRRSADAIDEGSRQEAQSNVGRRSDGTPD